MEDLKEVYSKRKKKQEKNKKKKTTTLNVWACIHKSHSQLVTLVDSSWRSGLTFLCAQSRGKTQRNQNSLFMTSLLEVIQGSGTGFAQAQISPWENSGEPVSTASVQVSCPSLGFSIGWCHPHQYDEGQALRKVFQIWSVPFANKFLLCI